MATFVAFCALVLALALHLVCQSLWYFFTIQHILYCILQVTVEGSDLAETESTKDEQAPTKAPEDELVSLDQDVIQQVQTNNVSIILLSPPASSAESLGT